PRWDLTTVFPSLESPEFAAAFHDATKEVQALVPLFDERQIRRRETGAVSVQDVRAFEEVTSRLNALYRDLRTLGSYINSFVATDAANDSAQALQSELQMTRVTLDQLETRYIAWVGSLDVPALLNGSELAREHEFFLCKAHLVAHHQMAEGEE